MPRLLLGSHGILTTLGYHPALYDHVRPRRPVRSLGGRVGMVFGDVGYRDCWLLGQVRQVMFFSCSALTRHVINPAGDGTVVALAHLSLRVVQPLYLVCRYCDHSKVSMPIFTKIWSQPFDKNTRTTKYYSQSLTNMIRLFHWSGS